MMSEKKSMDDGSSIEAALCAFANADEMEQKMYCLKELMKGGAIHSVHDDPRFVRSVEEAIREVQSGSDPKRKLLALTLIARIASRLKAKRDGLRQAIAVALRTPLPKLSELGDAEDRAYAAQTLRWAAGEWVIPYLGRSIVEEGAGEKTRAELVRALLEKAPDLAGALSVLRKPLAEWQPGTDAPGDSTAKRLKRILSVIRRELPLVEGPSGHDIGKTIRGLVTDAFRNVGPPESPDAAADIVAELALFLHDLVRTRSSLATKGAVYMAMRVPSRWFAGEIWPKSALKSLANLSLDIEESITLLAKQSISDNELLEALTLMEGSREGALRITSRIADQTTGLDKNIVQWLRRGRVTGRVQGAELIVENDLMNSDQALALLLIDSRRLAQMIDGPGQDLLNEMRIFAPDHEANTEALLKRVKALAEGVCALAGRRSLYMRGERGEVVDYSPTEHEGIDGSIVGARRVRIVHPLVERIQGDNIAEVVLRAEVEPE